MLIGHIRTKFLSPGVRLKILEINEKKNIDQMHNDKLARSGHDEILLVRMATLDKKMRPSLYSFDFKVNQHCGDFILTYPISNIIFLTKDDSLVRNTIL